MKECPQCHRCYGDLNSSCDDDGNPLVATLPGEPLIYGRYELEKRLGQGTVGVVFKAKEKSLKTSHAIKVITTELAGDDPSLAMRFRQQMLSAAEIAHPNLIRVTDFGLAQNSVPYLVMELVEGQTLAELLSQGQRMDSARALEILSAIAAGVAAAHKQGMAHGNLKPANIMLGDSSPDSALKILDLGLATLRRKEWSYAVEEQRTAFLQSAFYRAPELWFDDAPDPRSDVFSLAVIFYQMLTGVTPFKGDSIGEVQSKVMTQPVALFDSLGIELSPQLESVVFGALAKDRNDRTPTVEEFLSDVRRAIPIEDSWTAGAEGFEPELAEFQSLAKDHASSFQRDEIPDFNFAPAPDNLNKSAPIVDENVQFTVYRPRAVEPEVSYSILVYAHLAERAPDAPADSPEPREIVEEKAEEALGPAFHTYADTVEDSQLAIPRKGVLTFVPDFPGLTLAPPQHMLVWRGPVHELEFTFTAGRELEGRTIRGNVCVYLGAIVLAELNIAINVNTAKARQLAGEKRQRDPMPTYRKIFASYSHRDEAIVQQFEQLVDAFGDKYLRDVRDIRAGEKWNDRLQELIRDADIFQLFWSKNSMKSEFVKDEWNYALSLNKPNFIRPTFWEEPMPEDKQAGLPPASLLELQFKRVPILPVPGAPQTTPGYGSSSSAAAAEPSPDPTPLPPTPAPPAMRSMPPPASAPPTPKPPPPPPMRSMPPAWVGSSGGTLTAAPDTSITPPSPAFEQRSYEQARQPSYESQTSVAAVPKKSAPVLLWLVALIVLLVLAGGIALVVSYFLLS